MLLRPDGRFPSSGPRSASPSRTAISKIVNDDVGVGDDISAVLALRPAATEEDGSQLHHRAACKTRGAEFLSPAPWVAAGASMVLSSAPTALSPTRAYLTAAHSEAKAEEPSGTSASSIRRIESAKRQSDEQLSGQGTTLPRKYMRADSGTYSNSTMVGMSAVVMTDDDVVSQHAFQSSSSNPFVPLSRVPSASPASSVENARGEKTITTATFLRLDLLLC